MDAFLNELVYFSVCELCLNGIVLYEFFRFLLLLLHVLFTRFIRVPLCTKSHFKKINSNVDGYLACF